MNIGSEAATTASQTGTRRDAGRGRRPGLRPGRASRVVDIEISDQEGIE